MAKLITETIHYYNWNEVTQEVEKNCGKTIRDWAGKYAKAATNHGVSHQDFWHKLLDYDYSISDDCIRNFDFDDIADLYSAEPWVREICNEYIKILGKGEHTFKIQW